MKDEKAEEAGVLDTCPVCGKKDLVAVCEVIVEYAIVNTEDGQSWDRMGVDDDTSTPDYIRCECCGTEFRQFTLDGDGFLRSLTIPE